MTSSRLTLSVAGEGRRGSADALVHGVDQGDGAWVEQDMRAHAVHHVAETDPVLGIGEAERTAGAGMTERALAGAEARIGALLRQHEAEAEAGGHLQNQ